MSILLQGTITFGGQDIAYVVSEIENKINISVSFLRGSKLNNNVKTDIIFDKVVNSNNVWKLDRAHTKSQIDVNIVHNQVKDGDKISELWSLETENYLKIKKLKMMYEKTMQNDDDIQKNLFINADNKRIELNNEKYAYLEKDKLEDVVDINLDNFVKDLHNYSMFTRKSLESIVEELCEDFERTIKNQVKKENPLDDEMEKVEADSKVNIESFAELGYDYILSGTITNKLEDIIENEETVDEKDNDYEEKIETSEIDNIREDQEEKNNHVDRFLSKKNEAELDNAKTIDI